MFHLGQVLIFFDLNISLNEITNSLTFKLYTLVIYFLLLIIRKLYLIISPNLYLSKLGEFAALFMTTYIFQGF